MAAAEIVSGGLDLLGKCVTAVLGHIDSGIAAVDAAFERRFSLSALQLLQLFGATAAVFVLGLSLQNALSLFLPALLAQLAAWTVNGLVLRRMLTHLSSSSSVISFGDPEYLDDTAPSSPAADTTAIATSAHPPSTAVATSDASVDTATTVSVGTARSLDPFLENPGLSLETTHSIFPFPFEVLVHVFRERFSNLPDADYPEMKSVEPTKYEEFEGGQVIVQTLICTAAPKIPAALTRFVSVDDIQLEERSLLDLKRGTLEVRTRNLGFTDYMTLEGHFVWSRSGDHVDITSNCGMTLHKWWLRSASSTIVAEFNKAKAGNSSTMEKRAREYVERTKVTE